MKKQLVFISLLLGLIITQGLCQEAKNNIIRVMTYNIKYDDKNDKVNNWTKRKDEVVGLINYHKPGLFGTQEGLQHQLDYMKEHLQNFDYIGIGRDGGDGAGEYSAIFYDKTKFELLESATFWLSENPEQMGKSWDAALPRICTWGRFKHINSGKTVLFLNTHFDHMGETARLESAKLMDSKVDELNKKYPNAKVVVSGDFNFTPDAEPYQVITKSLRDTQTASDQLHYGPDATFNGFHFDQMPARRIDFIFVKEGIKVLEHATLTDSRGMRYPSDHFPVITVLEL